MIKQSFKFTAKEKRNCVLFTLFNIGLSALYLGVSFSTSLLIDKVIPQNNTTALIIWGIVFVAGYFAFHTMTAWIATFLFWKYQINITARYNTELARNYLNSFKNTDGDKTMNIILYDSDTAVGIRTQTIVEGVSACFGLLGSLAVMGYVSIPIMTAAAVLLPLFILFSLGSRKKLARLQNNERSAFDKTIGTVRNILLNKRSINITGKPDYFVNLYAKNLFEWLAFRFKYLFFYITVSELPKITTSVIKIIIAAIAAHEVMNGKISLGMLTFTIGALDVINAKINDIVNVLLRRSANAAAFERTESLYADKSEKETQKYKTNREEFFKINNVKIDFNNQANNNLFLRVEDFSIVKHGLYQIKGANGSGKSTLLNLINGFDNIEKQISVCGKIEINDNFSEKSAYLSAPHIYINKTVSENILLGENENGEFNNLVQMLGLTKEILDKMVVPNPLNLSYGEQQKIALARTLSKKSDILMLDEPFINLDLESCGRLRKYLYDISRTKAVIIISHDSETELLSDAVYEIKDNNLRLLPRTGDF